MSKLTIKSLTVGDASCSVYVEGLSMHCPLCGVLVSSGQTHHCEVAGRPAPPLSVKRPKKGKA